MNIIYDSAGTVQGEIYFIIWLETCIIHHATIQAGVIGRHLEDSGVFLGLPAAMAQVGHLQG